MMEKGSRKTAPPDTASVKVHKYNLGTESKHKAETHTGQSGNTCRMFKDVTGNEL